MEVEDELSDVRPRRVAVVHNVDFEDRVPPAEHDGFLSLEADAEVAQTAGHIAKILEEQGFETHLLQVGSSLEGLLPRLRELEIDAVFNLVESLGNDGTREAELPALLESAGIPYTGNSSSALQLAFMKDKSKRLLAAHRLPVPQGFCVHNVHELPENDDELHYPLFVKPARADASIGIDQDSIVRDRWNLTKKVAWLAKHVPGPILVEEYLPGPEVNVAIFPNPYDGLAVATQIDFSGCPTDLAPIVTYNCKWFPDSPEYAAVSRACEDQMPREKYARLLSIARAAFLVIGGTGYGRVDMRLNAEGRPVIMDINPNPDLDHEAGLAVAAKSAGLDYPTLLMRIVTDALRKKADVSAPHLAARPRAAGRFAAAYR